MSQQPEFSFTITPNLDCTEITNSTNDYELNICIVEFGLETQIKRGENVVSTLKHENIVRYITTKDWSGLNETYIMNYLVEFKEKFSVISFSQLPSKKG